MINLPEQPSEVERVARAICWEANGKDRDCNTVCMAANACRGPLNDCFIRDATAAIEAMRAATPAPVPDDDALTYVYNVIDAQEQVMLAERREQYGSAFRCDQEAAIRETYRQRKIGAKLALERIAARLATDTALVEALEEARELLVQSGCSVMFIDKALAARGGDNGK